MLYMEEKKNEEDKTWLHIIIFYRFDSNNY